MKQTKPLKSSRNSKKEAPQTEAAKTDLEAAEAPKKTARKTAPRKPAAVKKTAAKKAPAAKTARKPRVTKAAEPAKVVSEVQPVAPVAAPKPAPAAPARPAVPAAVPRPAPAAPARPAEVKPAAIAESKPAPQPPAPAKPALTKIKISTHATVRELAEKMGMRVNDFMKKLMTMGIFATINQRLDMDVATLVAEECGFELDVVPLYAEKELEAVEEKEEKPENLKSRPPVVTIMGHVDHGKTSLLDAIRRSNVVATESGAITQHIGAYRVETPRGVIVLLDTPGHEAFTAMRARGAKVTDQVVLVVSATDGIMPQTIEAIDHAKAAGVPIIVAINKIDLPGANPQKIKQDLANIGLNPEEWGGKTIMVELSAKKNINIDKLLEMILLQAEILELRANPDRPGIGTILEAKLDPKRGSVATVLISTGSLKIGDSFVAGISHGKVRALVNDYGERIQSIGPSMPAEILGISGKPPQAGDILTVVESEKEAKHIAEKRKLAQREDSFAHQRHVSLLALKSQIQQKLLKELKIILKADVQGSIQAIRDSLEKLSTQEVGVLVIHSGAGNINESDILLAKASDAIILGFHVDTDQRAAEEADRSGVEIRRYEIIYDLLGDVTAAMSGLLEPEVVETVTGRAEIRQVFDLSSGKVAGTMVLEGKLLRGQPARILRKKEIVYRGRISTLKRFKEDVKEVEKGFDCGVTFDGFKDFQPGDLIEAVTKETKTRRLEQSKA